MPSKKPAPDIYLWVLERLGLPASACLAFEDSANGLRASLAAGLPTLVTESEYTLDHDFSGAFAVLLGPRRAGEAQQVRRGDMHGKGFVDVELLRIWHREIISSS